MKKIFLISALLVFLFSFNAFAQEDITDMNWSLMPEDEIKADSLVEVSWTYILNGDWDNAKKYALQGKQLSEELEYNIGFASSLMRLGIIAQYADQNYSTAEGFFRQAFQIRKEAGYLLDAVRAYNNLIGVLKAQNNLEEAVKTGNIGLMILQTISNETVEFLEVKARLHNLLGAVFRNQANPLEALKHSESSLEIRRKLKDKKAIAKSLLSLGNLYSEEVIGNYKKAKECFQEGLGLTRETNDVIHEARMLLALGYAHFYLKDFATALSYYRQVQTLPEEIGSDDRTKALRNIGNIYMEQENPSLALKEWLKCETIFRSSDNIIELSSLFTDIGRAYHQLLQDKEALKYLKLGLSTARKLNNSDLNIYALNHLALFYAHQKEYKKAHLLNQESLELQKELSKLAQDAMIYKSNMEQERREKAELEKERIQLAQEKAELKNRNLKQLGLLIISGLLLLLLVASFYAYANKKNKQIAWQEVDNLLYEQELKMTYARLEGRATEREKIARDLHDRLGGMLATVKLYFAPIEAKLESIQENSKNQYIKAIALLDESCEEVRRISHNMISNSLREYGLKYILEEMGERIQHSGQLKVDVDTFGLEERFDREKEIHIYRIIQELVSNVLKHANAKKLIIQLNHFDNVINIIVEDDGVGFDKKSTSGKHNGIGLENISNRVNRLKGTWNIDSIIGRGTTISIDIPV